MKEIEISKNNGIFYMKPHYAEKMFIPKNIYIFST
jgi:hypothetical protein